MNMAEVYTDASKITQMSYTLGEWWTRIWNYEHAQLVLLLIVLAMILYASVGCWLIAFGKGGYNYFYGLFEGTRMRWSRERELDAIWADGIYDLSIKLEEADKISADEKKLYLSRFGNLVPIKDLLPKNQSLTLKERLAAKWAKIIAPKTTKHPREQLAGLLRSKTTTTGG